jgi:4-carboxymuconolactone decarboxylase
VNDRRDDDDWHYDPAARDTYLRVVQRSPAEPTPFRELTVSMIGKMWSGPHLSIRERRLVTLSVLAMSSTPRELEVHLRAALQSGDLSPDDLDQLCFQLAMYAGWPRAAVVQAALAELRAQSLDADKP